MIEAGVQPGGEQVQVWQSGTHTDDLDRSISDAACAGSKTQIDKKGVAASSHTEIDKGGLPSRATHLLSRNQPLQFYCTSLF